MNVICFFGRFFILCKTTNTPVQSLPLISTADKTVGGKLGCVTLDRETPESFRSAYYDWNLPPF